MKILALLFATLVWGWTFVLVKQGAGEIGTLWFLALRFTIAALLALVPLAGRLKRTEAADWLRGGILGLILFAGYYFQTLGLLYTTAQKSGLITGLSVVLVPPLALLFGQRTPWKIWTGTALAAIGLVLLVLGEGTSLGPAGWGDFLTLLCAVAFALYIVLLDRYVKQGDFLTLLPPQLGTVGLLALGGAFAFESPSLAISAAAWEAILITGILASTVAFYLLSWAQQHLSASYTAIILATEPAFAALFGWLLLGETLTPVQTLGAILIFLGITVPQLLRAVG